MGEFNSRLGVIEDGVIEIEDRVQKLFSLKNRLQDSNKLFGV